MSDDGETRAAGHARWPTTAGAVVVLRGDGREVALCRVADLGPADLATVDALARLQLVARRRGWSIGLRGRSEELRRLRDLLGLVGLAAVVEGPHPAGADPA